MDNKDQIRIARSVAIKLAFESPVGVSVKTRWVFAQNFTDYILTGAVPKE